MDEQNSEANIEIPGQNSRTEDDRESLVPKRLERSYPYEGLDDLGIGGELL